MARDRNESGERFRVVYDPAFSRRANRFVVRGFLAPGELLQAVLRMFLTREAVLLLLGPLGLLAVSGVVPPVAGVDLPLILAGVASIWLLVGAVFLLRLGESHAIGVFHGDRIVGGVRLKVSRRRIRLAGVFVERSYRGRGMFAALLKASLDLTARSAGREGADFCVFAAAHPASRRVVQKYFRGRRVIRVAREAGEEHAQAIELLREELTARSGEGIDYEFALTCGFFDRCPRAGGGEARSKRRGRRIE